MTYLQLKFAGLALAAALATSAATLAATAAQASSLPQHAASGGADGKGM